MIPQLIWLGLFVAGLSIVAFKHGERVEQSIGISLFAYAIMWTIYWFGGVFDTVGIPEFFLLAGYTLGVVNVTAASVLKAEVTYNALVTYPVSLAYVIILYFCGFFDSVIGLL